MRYGLDIRRIHADQIGGNNVVGTFAFSGLNTESPTDKGRHPQPHLRRQHLAGLDRSRPR